MEQEELNFVTEFDPTAEMIYNLISRLSREREQMLAVHKHLTDALVGLEEINQHEQMGKDYYMDICHAIEKMNPGIILLDNKVKELETALYEEEE